MNDALNLNKTDEIEEIEEVEEINEVEEIEEIKEENIFLSSLENLTAKDIDLNETAQTAKKPSIDFVRYFIISICLSIFVYAGYSIVQQLLGYAEAANEHDAIREMFYGRDDALREMQILRRARTSRPIQDILSLQRQTTRDVGVVVSEGVTEADQRRAQLEGVFAHIPNMFGWIKISHTDVDYPVVQSDDNYYYLDRNVYGHIQFSGSIYVDYRNDRNVDNNLNTILYGHNMQNGTMFSSLMNFAKSQEAFENGRIEFTTPDGIYIYEIFSVYTVDPFFYYREVTFHSEEWYVEWLYEMKSLSWPFQKEDIVFTPESRIMTLSTCTNHWGNPRFAVHAVLIDVLRYSDR
jgi:sortase B